MRFWLVALMVALLPVRGWMGDVMAANAIAQHLGTAAGHKTPLAENPAGHPADHSASASVDMSALHAECQGHAETAGLVTGKAMTDGSVSVDCGTCLACQVCHSALLGPAEPFAVGGSVPPAAAINAGVAFASAELFRDIKPPIS